MSTRPFLAALFALFPALLFAADVSVPNTPAGQALTEWLDAFNSASRARQASFISTYARWMNLDSTVNWRADTGGYDLLEVYSNDKMNVFFRVRARATAAQEVGRLKVSKAEPVAIAELVTWRIPAGATWHAVPLDATARHRLIQSVADEFYGFYVDPEIGKKMAAGLREREKRGEYRAMLYGIDLANKLTADLQGISHDKHVAVRFSFFARPVDSATNQPVADSRLVAGNCGFLKAEYLQAHIGYVKFDMFADPEICAVTAGAALTFLADSAALILDLRDNRGGHPGMVAFVASYLFDQSTHLNDIFNRAENATHAAWTLPYVPGKKFVGKPVFVLTSKQTFSAAEDFSYALKNLQRATLIGETTLGGAHPTELKRIDDHFSVAVPYARSISPLTKTNWEGTGVEPDVKAPADQALAVALKLAAEETANSATTFRR